MSSITNEIGAWCEYLVGQDVEMRGPLRDSTNHPAHGFVANDPEDYYLEFDLFSRSRHVPGKYTRCRR